LTSADMDNAPPSKMDYACLPTARQYLYRTKNG
jgi:hypothetical protein